VYFTSTLPHRRRRTDARDAVLSGLLRRQSSSLGRVRSLNVRCAELQQTVAEDNPLLSASVESDQQLAADPRRLHGQERALALQSMSNPCAQHQQARLDATLIDPLGSRRRREAQ
jgi:hypothetical protein